MKQIYTGYRWRPMTEAELEIMEANRIVDEQTDDAQAGDIYDGPDKCLYCIGDANHNAELVEEDGTLAYIDGLRLRIETFAWDGSATDVDTKINYCPMCGRKLEENDG